MDTPPLPSNLNIDSDKVQNGLAQLVLAIINMLHELLERQAIRRMEANQLTEEEIERLGTTLMKQAHQLDQLREAFGLKPDDLTIDLGQFNKLV